MKRQPAAHNPPRTKLDAKLRKPEPERPAQPLGQTPPPDIAKDDVLEADWESFPASDPPASGSYT